MPAHMIPPQPPADERGYRAEHALWHALHDGLDDSFFVYYSLRFLEDDTAMEGECDFVVLHRALGLLVIECKGGGVYRDRQGQWFRTAPDGRRERLDERPHEQAARLMHGLVDELEERIPTLDESLRRAWRGDRLPWRYGWALAFPLARRVEHEATPLELDDALLLQSDALADIEGWVRRAFAFWQEAGGRKERTALPQAVFKRVRKALLHPSLRIVEDLGAHLDADARSLQRLTEGQFGVLRVIAATGQARVRGGAGTGKTLMALQTAHLLAARGARVLLLVFNRALALFLAERVAAMPPTEGTIDATSFHRLCYDAACALGEPGLQPPQGEDEQSAWWRDVVPLKTLEAFTAGKLERYDALVVDEGQDFDSGWWTVLEAAVRDGQAGKTIIFYDPDQALFDVARSGMPRLPEFVLTMNCRNPQALIPALARLRGAPIVPHPMAPLGEPPVWIEARSPGRTVRLLEGRVAALLEAGVRPEQIVVLTPSRRQHSSLADVTSLCGLPLVDLRDRRDRRDRRDAGGQRTPAPAGGALVTATIGAFKGLEAAVVCLVDIDPAHPRCSREARYVAASRATGRLLVFGPTDWLADCP